MKPILVFLAPSVLETPKSVFESPPLADFQKPIFIMIIAAFLTWNNDFKKLKYTKNYSASKSILFPWIDKVFRI